MDEVLSQEEIIEKITKALKEMADPEYLQWLANEVLDLEVKYIGDFMFTIGAEQ